MTVKEFNITKKEWLKEYVYLKQNYQYYINELQEIQQEKLGLTRVLTGMPSSNVTKNMDDVWIDLIDYTDDIIEYLKGILLDRKTRLTEITEAVEQLDERERTVITARYIRGMSFRDILKDLPVSEKTMYNLHQRALQHLEMPTAYGDGLEVYEVV